MRVKSLFKDRFSIVAVMDKDECPVENFILGIDLSDESACEGMFSMLEYVAKNGLDKTPAKWIHEASKPLQIFQFRKGDFRLFFFKGKNGQIAVCTAASRKSGQKADSLAVSQAARWRESYFQALSSGSLTVLEATNEDE